MFGIFSLLIVNACNKTVAKNNTEELAAESTAIVFPNQSGDPEIVNMRQAMVDFRQTLSADLLAKADNSLNSERFYLWHNTPAVNFRGNGFSRTGIMYGDLTPEQLNAFKVVLRLFLSN
ncbi:MAG: DUF3500 domain-containing protein, partial [Bacteroidota bacterium]